VRLAAQFDFSIEPATRAQIAQLAGRIREASPERIRDELWKALATQHPDQVIDELRELGLLEHLLPELTATMGVTQSPPHHLDVYHHTLLVMKHAAYLRDRLLTTADESAAPGGATTAQRIERDALAPLWPALVHHFRQRLGAERRRAQWLVWHALFHDVGKPRTRTVESTDGGVRIRFLRHEQEGAQMTADRLAALRVSRREISLAESVVRCHMRPHSLHDSFASGRISRRALYRFYRDCDGQPARPTGVDVALLALADYRAIHRALLDAEPAPDALAAWRDYADHVRQLLEFGLASDGWAAIRQEPLVNGHVLMEALDLQPGPELGRLLERLAEAQAAGEIQTPEDALQWAAHWLAEHSTDPDAANATVYASESG
jgi:tRNA nucleotidyltransferase/poly(A) polymerase